MWNIDVKKGEKNNEKLVDHVFLRTRILCFRPIEIIKNQQIHYLIFLHFP